MMVSVRGAELCYKLQGTGPACIVPTAIGTPPYERQLEGLGACFTLAIVDLRGGGRSTGDPAGLTLDVLADDLDAVRRDIGAERALVLGHSTVGILAVEYARRRPTSISHVISVGMPPKGDMAFVAREQARFFEQDASADRKQVLRANQAALPKDAPFARAFYAETPRRFFDPRFDAAPLFAGAETRPALLRHMMGPLTSGWSVIEAAPALRAPLLVALGRFDYVVPHDLWNAVASRLPGTTVHVFERSGHQPFVEEPEEFRRVVSDWMTASPPTRSV
jgi:proline iminopeptidase